ncbi:hypothetical protein AK812_SmicGene14638 [Symbiodinium microadriaticum]|uniref:Uncharacterized protein n=1 Tax=Symbiodinium microadriaticum TaxID=2951 RepID=A0A1Q9E4Z1_SYMMI|nr:hypothetical protein AK812_SmicGene14638 [Symbiodinium microadriaticum]
MIELLATVVAVQTFREEIHGKLVLLFIDSEPVEAALIKGYSAKEDVCELVGIFWELVLELRCSVYIDRVPTDSNPADNPSKRHASHFIGHGYAGLLLLGKKRPAGGNCSFVNSQSSDDFGEEATALFLLPLGSVPSGTTRRSHCIGTGVSGAAGAAALTLESREPQEPATGLLLSGAARPALFAAELCGRKLFCPLCFRNCFLVLESWKLQAALLLCSSPVLRVPPVSPLAPGAVKCAALLLQALLFWVPFAGPFNCTWRHAWFYSQCYKDAGNCKSTEQCRLAALLAAL